MGILKSIKSFRWGYLAIAIILCVAGACFVIYPTQAMNITSYIIGLDEPQANYETPEPSQSSRDYEPNAKGN